MVNWAKYPINQLHINCFVLWKYRQNLFIYLKNAFFFMHKKRMSATTRAMVPVNEYSLDQLSELIL